MREEYTCNLTNRLITDRCSEISKDLKFKPKTVYNILENCVNRQGQVLPAAAYLLESSELQYLVDNDVQGVKKNYFYSKAYDRGGILCGKQVLQIFYNKQNNYNSDSTNWIIFIYFVSFGSVLASVVLTFLCLMSFEIGKKIWQSEQQNRVDNADNV